MVNEAPRNWKSYGDFFEQVTGSTPYPYQQRLGEERWPDLLDVPTGLGKTAAVAVAWLWKRLTQPEEASRRLVYCLPMRTLVEQTYREIERWCERARPYFDRSSEAPSIHVLMSGADDIWSRDPDNDWYRWPERPAILIGTQDMLLSRALMRGYAMSLYSWPIHFAFLHSDALWLFDEVQLMGPAIATSAQLEAFRRHFPAAGRASQSLWCSATIARSWLDTVDLRSAASNFNVARLSDDDERLLQKRLDANKRLVRATTVLTNETSKKNAAVYSRTLIDEVLAAHRRGTRTMVIVNTVARAQAIFRELKKRKQPAGTMLVHSRFRPPDRRRLEELLRSAPLAEGTIVIATQVVEAGVDISAATLFTEISPWSSFVQRCGRCNRYGEFEQASVFWIDFDLAEPSVAHPYLQADVARGRQRAEALESAAPRELSRMSRSSGDDPPPRGKVLRKKDLLELFSTEADLTGFMVDVSDYIRDTNERSVYLFWRQLGSEHSAASEDRPDKNEICSAPIAAVQELLKRRTHDGSELRAWKWDPLAGEDGDGSWVRVRSGDVYPGITLILDASIGGYSNETGFDTDAENPVDPVERRTSAKPPSYAEDRGAKNTQRWMELVPHLVHTREIALSITGLLGVQDDFGTVVADATLWHDVGKAHPMFQRDLLRRVKHTSGMRLKLWAKSGPVDDEIVENDPAPKEGRRRYFRHELASALMVLEHDRSAQKDLVAYLVAAHHGRVRTSLRSLPDEPRPDDLTKRFARGVWDGDVLPPISFDSVQTPETILRLDVVDLGGGASGKSWGAHVGELLSQHGPFRLAWLEGLVRIADWRASAAHEIQPDETKEGA